jgi:hypothetical protein
MVRFEGEIGAVAAERMQDAGDAPAPSPLRRLESFAVDNMQGLAVGASAGILMVAAVVTLTGGAPTRPAPPPDPIVVGSTLVAPRLPVAPQWQAVRKPVEMMALQAPQFEKSPPLYAARRTAQNDREDALVFQPAAPGGAEARIALLRHAAAAGAAPSLFIDMTRLQAERGVAVTRAGAPGQLQTKFGAVEVADMTFSDASGGAQACLGFRRAADGDAPAIAGWYCGAEGAVVERPELACFIDRLTLLKGGEDQALRRFFAEAEQRRRPCPNARVTAGRKPTWLDHDGRAPAMRGSEETTGSIGSSRR